MNKKYKQWKKILAHPAVITLVAIVSFIVLLLLLNLVSKVLFVLLRTLVSLKHQGASSDPVLLKELPKKILSYVQSTSPFQFAPVLGEVSFISTLLVILVWLLFMPKKLYQMRIAFRDINKGTKGVARWTTFKEMIQQYPIVALDHKEYEGESGVPVLHFNLNPFRYFFGK